MIDDRVQKLAKLVVRYCIEAKPNEDIVISASSEAEKFVKELYKELILAKADPLIKMHPEGIDYFYFKHATKRQLKSFQKEWYDSIKKAEGYIEVDTEFNTKELSNISQKKIAIREKTLEKIDDYIFNSKKVKNVLVAFPCHAHAQDAEMSIEEWENFVFSACLIDWKKFSEKYEKIAKKFHRGEKIELIGEGVDLKFSIKNRKAVLDNGKENMPGGEIYMAPIKGSLEGWIKFDFPGMYEGKEIRDIFLRFKKGKTVEARASKNERILKRIIKTDKNARYIGEFGIGVNPKIKKFTNNLLFDEKINGTVHLALGMAYIENGGGNDSLIHWDLVKNMKHAKMILDGKIIQENGRWKI